MSQTQLTRTITRKRKYKDEKKIELPRWYETLTFFALDTETANPSLQKDQDRVIEVGFVKFQGQTIQDEFSSLCCSVKEIDTFSFAKHNITIEMLAGQPTFEQVVLPMWHNAMLTPNVAVLEYSGMEYDFRMIQKEIGLCAKTDNPSSSESKANTTTPIPPWLDVCIMIRHIDKFKRGKKLVEACQRRNITFQAHRALSDARALAQLFMKIAPEIDKEMGYPDNIHQVRALLQAWKVEQDTQYQQYKVKQAEKEKLIKQQMENNL